MIISYHHKYENIFYHKTILAIEYLRGNFYILKMWVSQADNALTCCKDNKKIRLKNFHSLPFILNTYFYNKKCIYLYECQLM